MTKRNSRWQRKYGKWKSDDGYAIQTGQRKIYRAKRNKELRQMQQSKKLRDLIVNQMVQDEFEKAEYQRTGIQH